MKPNKIGSSFFTEKKNDGLLSFMLLKIFSFLYYTVLAFPDLDKDIVAKPFLSSQLIIQIS
jgi:hypothetical protein